MAVTYSCPSPVMGCALRITRLNECGVPIDPLTPFSRIQTKSYSQVQGSPQVEDSQEIMLQTACSEIETLYYTPKRLKSFDWSMVLTNVNLPILNMLIDADLFEAPDDPSEFIGFVLRNSLTAPSPNPKMIEVQSPNANRAQCGVGGTGSAAVYRHLFPWVYQIEIDQDLTIELNSPFTIAFKGIALNNPNFFPSFPSTDFPSYVPAYPAADGVPTGAPPPLLPPGIDADPYTLEMQIQIQAGGPYAGFTEATFFDTFECSVVGAGS